VKNFRAFPKLSGVVSSLMVRPALVNYCQVSEHRPASLFITLDGDLNG
jgi:hypothetical protein